jgi:hypothetical protein
MAAALATLDVLERGDGERTDGAFAAVRARFGPDA